MDIFVLPSDAERPCSERAKNISEPPHMVPMSRRNVYFDNSATTSVAPEVLDSMMPFLTSQYGNPSSIHWMGDDAAKAVRNARRQVADTLGCLPSEIFFTSGGTESDNIALMGSRNGRVITSSIEHSAILETCAHMRSQGRDVMMLEVDEDGIVDPDSLRKTIDDDVSIVSIMAANNVIGTIQPIKELADIAHEHGAIFHTDAVQAYTKIGLNVKDMGIDLLSISGHKIHGPKGVGALYVNEKIEMEPIMFGGGQEFGLRPSTENVPGIVGLGKAAELAAVNMDSDIRNMTVMRDRIIDETLNIEGSALNGSRERRLCNNAHFRFKGIKGTDLILRLSKERIAASTASACSAGSTEPSHVMTAIGLNAEESMSALRISLSRYNTLEDVDILMDVLPQMIKKMRM